MLILQIYLANLEISVIIVLERGEMVGRHKGASGESKGISLSLRS